VFCISLFFIKKKKEINFELNDMCALLPCKKELKTSNRTDLTFVWIH